MTDRGKMEKNREKKDRDDTNVTDKKNRNDTNDTNDSDKTNTDKLIRDALEGSISHYRDYDYDVIKETIIICRSRMKESSKEESSNQIQQSSKEESSQQSSSKEGRNEGSKESSKEGRNEGSQQSSSQSSLHYQYNHWSVVYKACCRLMARYVIDMSADEIIEEFNLLD